MSKNETEDGLQIDYRFLGTIAIDEFLQAVVTDLKILKEEFNVKYVTAPQLRVPVTNEYGDPVVVRAPTGGRLVRFDTHHYRPACKDYGL